MLPATMRNAEMRKREKDLLKAFLIHSEFGSEFEHHTLF